MTDGEVDLWAMDEVQFQQHGSTCKMWIPPEDMDPVVFHEPTRRKVGFFGAVRLVDGRFVHRREEESFNAQSCWTFLKYLRKVTAPTGERTLLIIDNAKYHHARLHREWREGCEERFALLFMPPYSPELNPAERVWKLTRRLCTHNRYIPDIQEMVLRVESQFDEWRFGSETLRRLCAIS